MFGPLTALLVVLAAVVISAVAVFVVIPRRAASRGAPRPRFHVGGTIAGLVLGAIIGFVLFTRLSPQTLLLIGLALVAVVRSIGLFVSRKRSSSRT